MTETFDASEMLHISPSKPVHLGRSVVQEAEDIPRQALSVDCLRDGEDVAGVSACPQ